MENRITLWDLLKYMRADTLAQMSADLDEETGLEADKLYAAVWDALLAVVPDTAAAMRMIGAEMKR